MSNLYEHIDTAKKFAGQGGSVQESTCAADDKTKFALDVAKRLAESKPEEPKPVQLGTQPIAN